MKYTAQQNNFLSENRLLSRKALTSAFNQQFSTELSQEAISAVMKRRRWLNGWKRTGLPPANAGQNTATLFKPGHAVRSRPIGSRYTSKGIPYIKIAEPDVWQSERRHVWEQHNDPIPDGHLIIAIDPDQPEVHIDNLVMLSNSELARLNQNGFYTAPLAARKTLILISQVQAKAHEKKE